MKIKKEPAFENLSLCKSDILTGILNEIKSKNGCRDKKRFVTLLVKENSAFCSGKTLECAFMQRDSLTHYQSCLYFVEDIAAMVEEVKMVTYVYTLSRIPSDC